ECSPGAAISDASTSANNNLPFGFVRGEASATPSNRILDPLTKPRPSIRIVKVWVPAVITFGRSLRSCGASSWARTTDCFDTSGQSAIDNTIITANKLTTVFLSLLLPPVLTLRDAGRGTL